MDLNRLVLYPGCVLRPQLSSFSYDFHTILAMFGPPSLKPRWTDWTIQFRTQATTTSSMCIIFKPIRHQPWSQDLWAPDSQLFILLCQNLQLSFFTKHNEHLG